MSEIRYRSQKYDDSCAVACVAMIAGRTEGQACEAIFDTRRPGKYEVVGWTKIRKALARLGVNCKARARGVTKWQSIRSLSIVDCHVRAAHTVHTVIYDPENGLVFDPDPYYGKPVPISKFPMKPYSYLPVKRPHNGKRL
jgi:hypothetical protein